MDKLFHLTIYWACDYLYMLGLKLIHVNIRGPRWETSTCILYDVDTMAVDDKVTQEAISSAVIALT